MKQITSILFAIIFGLTATAQTTRIADNNANRPTGPNIYSSVQAAHDAAVAGDIVYVQPSLTSYGDLTINKQIILRGIGFNTGKDLSYSSILGNIALSNRIDNTSNSSGSIIEGVIVNEIYLGNRTGSFNFTLTNILIQNCQINRILTHQYNTNMPLSNITITRCVTEIALGYCTANQFFIYGNFIRMINTNYGCGKHALSLANGTLTNCIISNNVFDAASSFGFNNIAASGVVITNNNFLGGNNVSGSRLLFGTINLGFVNQCATPNFLDVIFTNNIFYGCAPNSTSTGPFERNVFSNNLSFGTTNNALPPAGTGVGNTGSNNLVNQDPLFVNAPYNTAYASTMDFNLQATSPAKNAGSDGTDIGITGGAYPVTAGNITLRPSSVPVMMSLNPAALVPQNQPVKTNIKAKSN